MDHELCFSSVDFKISKQGNAFALHTAGSSVIAFFLAHLSIMLIKETFFLVKQQNKATGTLKGSLCAYEQKITDRHVRTFSAEKSDQRN